MIQHKNLRTLEGIESNLFLESWFQTQSCKLRQVQLYLVGSPQPCATTVKELSKEPVVAAKDRNAYLPPLFNPQCPKPSQAYAAGDEPAGEQEADLTI